MVELITEKAWSKESNIEIFMAQNMREESELLVKMLGYKVNELDKETVRIDGEKVLLI